MNKKLQILHNNLDKFAKKIDDQDFEFCFARDLQNILGFERWENFYTAIVRAIESCETSKYKALDHFRGVTKSIEVHNGAIREIDDFMLTRYVCYLIAQNGDSSKLLSKKNNINKL